MGFIFQPKYGSNQSVSATGTSASIALDGRTNVVRITNTGTTNVAHIRIGAVAQTATSADLVIMPGASELVRKGDADIVLAYVSASGTTLQIITGSIYTG